MLTKNRLWVALLALCAVIAIPCAATVWAADSMVAANPEAADANAVSMQPPNRLNGSPIAQPVTWPADPQKIAQIKRGMYIATAGDCQYCHSVDGGKPYAGGAPLQSPVGDLFSPNITPDKQYGIGNYSEGDFWNVIHNGFAPQHNLTTLLVFPSYLYPVMPYQDYAKLSRPDVDALKAYLDSIQPVAKENRPSQMPFPFDMRVGMLAWQLVFFNKDPIKYDASWSPQVRNGAFLVQALEHCAECHSARNIAMAIEPSRRMAGGHILAQSWYAPDITKDPAGIGNWSSDDLFQFLHEGGDTKVGVPYGPMQAVVGDSLSRLPASDVHDIVAYLQQGTPDKAPDIQPVDNPASPELGKQVYQEDCARCHGVNGEGVANNFPNLAGNPGVTGGRSDNVISMVIGGYESWKQNGSFMPEFNQKLSDEQIAAVTNYVRTAWGNQGVADATASKVGEWHGVASDWVSLSTGTTQAELTGDSLNTRFDDIDGKVEMFGDHINCMLDADLKSSNPAHSASIVGTCGPGGGSFLGNMMVDGKPYPVKLRMRETATAGHLSGIDIWGKLPDSDETFTAQIALNASDD
jgi:mono/diheme cytochrome c family protein